MVGISRIIGLLWCDLHVDQQQLETNIVKSGAFVVFLVSNLHIYKQ